MINDIYEQLVEEDWKHTLGTTAVAVGLGIGTVGVAQGFPKEDFSKQVTTNQTYFNTKEYETIKKAAIRNGIVLDSEDFRILLAIRKAENGPAGTEFGILHPKAKETNLDIQAGWAAATIKKNRERWIASGKKEDFISFLGNRYCPVGVKNDPKGLNKNWIQNVRHWVLKIS